MASSIHLLIDGIEGESQDSGHPGEIDITNYHFAISSPASTSGGGFSAGKATASEFSFSMYRGKSTAKLMELANKGTHVPTITLKISKTTGADKVEVYNTIVFTDCLFTMVGFASSEGDPTPMDSLSFAFAKMDFVYKAQKTAGGTLEVAGTTGWNYKANEKAA